MARPPVARQRTSDPGRAGGVALARRQAKEFLERGDRMGCVHQGRAVPTRTPQHRNTERFVQFLTRGAQLAEALRNGCEGGGRNIEAMRCLPAGPAAQQRQLDDEQPPRPCRHWPEGIEVLFRQLRIFLS